MTTRPTSSIIDLMVLLLRIGILKPGAPEGTYQKVSECANRLVHKKSRGKL